MSTKMKPIEFKLAVLIFLNFFIWGSWLTSIGSYMLGENAQGVFEAGEIGTIFIWMGFASLLTPALMGIIADKWLNAEKVLGIAHIISALFLILAGANGTNPTLFKTFLVLHMFFFMPTIGLSYSVSYNALEKEGLNLVKTFPRVRIWGTIGFVVAMWIVDLSGFRNSVNQLYIGAIASILLGLYSFTMPAMPPSKQKGEKIDLYKAFGFDAFALFKRKKIAIFFIFCFLLGIALQITNSYGGSFIDSFKDIAPSSWAVENAGIVSSLAQISEILCILLIPFVMGKFGIKRVMIISMIAWALRFGFFAIGGPEGFGLVFVLLSMAVYGMAFDFFNVSGSLFIEQETDISIRSSAQGLFMIMGNGLGSIVGMFAFKEVLNYFTTDGKIDWQPVWIIAAAYAVVIAILFAILFQPNKGKKAQS